jgi:hypothetical protein
LGSNIVLAGDVTLAEGSKITGATVANFGAAKADQIAQIKKISGGAGVVITAPITVAAGLADFAAITETKVIASNGETDLSGIATFVVAAGNDITLTAAVASVGAVNVNGTLTLSDGGVTLGTASGVITIGSTGKLAFTGAAASLAPKDNIIVDAGGELALNNASAVLTLAAGKDLTLHGAAGTGGAKLTGAGILKAGKTEIVGNDGWQAVAATTTSTGTVVIGANAADTDTTITGAEGIALTALGDGTSNPTITQTAVASNNLIIAADTTIALGGDGAAVGKIVLKGAVSNAGALSFANAGSNDVGTSLVTTGATGNQVLVTGTVSAPAGTALKWYAANDTSGGKWSKVGASADTNGLTGGGSGVDVTLSGGTTVTAA